MARQNKRKEASNKITKTAKNNIQVNLRLKAIQEDACLNLFSEMYDTIFSLSKRKWPYSASTCMIGAGVSGIISWSANLKELGKSTFEKFWEENQLYLLLIAIGAIILLVLYMFHKHRSLNEKKEVLDHYLNSEKWDVVSQPSSLILDKQEYSITPESNDSNIS